LVPSSFDDASLQRIRDLKRLYHLDLGAAASHQLAETTPARRPRSGRRRVTDT
jgi:hypothetical protein